MSGLPADSRRLWKNLRLIFFAVNNAECVNYSTFTPSENSHTLPVCVCARFRNNLGRRISARRARKGSEEERRQTAGAGWLHWKCRCCDFTAFLSATRRHTSGEMRRAGAAMMNRLSLSRAPNLLLSLRSVTRP